MNFLISRKAGRFSGLLFLHDAEQRVKRRARDHTVKLGSEVGEDANVINDDVVDFPIRVDPT